MSIPNKNKEIFIESKSFTKLMKFLITHEV